MEAIAFRAAETDLGNFLFANRGATIHVAGTLAANHWNGTKRIQMRLQDAASA